MPVEAFLFTNRNTLAIKALHTGLQKVAFWAAKDRLSGSEMWPFTTPKAVFYKSIGDNLHYARPCNGLSLRYFEQATFRPRHTAFIISVACHAQPTHGFIAVTRQRCRQTVNRLTAAHTERYVYIACEQCALRTLNGVGTRHNLKPRAVRRTTGNMSSDLFLGCGTCHLTPPRNTL